MGETIIIQQDCFLPPYMVVNINVCDHKLLIADILVGK